MVLMITDKQIDSKSLRNTYHNGDMILQGVFKLNDDLYDAIKDYSPIIDVVKKPEYNYDINIDIVWDQNWCFHNSYYPTVFLLSNFNPQGKEISIQLSLLSLDIESYIKLTYF